MRVLVSGYYGFNNAGDEALLAGMLRALAKAGSARVTVLSNNPRETQRLHGVRAMGRDNFSALWRQLHKNTDLFISGGGGLIQDRTSRRSALYYLGLIRMAQRAGVPTYLYAQGVGPVRSTLVRAFARRTLKRVTAAGVRDPESARSLVELGAPDSAVSVTADAAFALPPIGTQAREELLKAHGISNDGRPLIGIVWRSPIVGRRGSGQDGVQSAVQGAAQGARGGVAQVAKVMAALADRVDGRIVVISLYPGVDEPEAIALRNALMKAGCSRVEHIQSAFDFRTLRALIEAMDLNLCVRYHGVLFSALGGVPAVALEYDPKVRHLAGQLGLPCLSFPVDNEALSQALHTAWQQRAALRRHLAHRVEDLREKALAEGMRALLAGQSPADERRDKEQDG